MYMYLLNVSQIREASQALLQAELRRIQFDGRKKLVVEWAGKLQSPAGYRSSGERTRQIYFEEGDSGEIGSEEMYMYMYMFSLMSSFSHIII